jgi:hypothetical protein
MNDPADEFLGTDFTGPAPPLLREAVFAGTARVLRRRRRRRRLAWAGGMAACFLGGMITTALWRPSEANDSQAQRPQVKEAPKQTETSEAKQAEPSLVDLEWLAFDTREHRSALFFQVGHRYLTEQNDYDAALRCYRQALDAAPSEDLAIRPDDNWLVMALKEARQKENNDAMVTP